MHTSPQTVTSCMTLDQTTPRRDWHKHPSRTVASLTAKKSRKATLSLRISHGTDERLTEESRRNVDRTAAPRPPPCA